MNWPAPILTDSGGYQVMSLAQLRKVTEEGVTFQSHIDGRKILLTPEGSINIQRRLGSDITMVFDECLTYPADERDVAASMQLSMRWAKRSKEAFVERPGHGLFGINQGGAFTTLRAESAAALNDIGFDGYAIGSLAVGEERDVMFAMIEATTPLLPEGKPRYLMGVGKPADLVGAVARGIDMFDCVLPTRSGRTGQAFTRLAAVNLRNARHADDTRPLDDACGCPTCRQYTRAYLHHLVRAGEILASILLTWHNLHYYQDLMAGVRAAIEAASFDAFAAQFTTDQQTGDIEPL
jgi:queuine tRNA-ribosyltransferase